jgi:protoporphyrinogen/coproporphyrinogen III oxidase
MIALLAMAPGYPAPQRLSRCMAVMSGHAAAELMDASDGQITDRFLAELHSLNPESRPIVAETRVRWPLGNVFARSGLRLLQPSLKGPLGPSANLHLAGDYFAEPGNMEAAAKTGTAAAARIRAALS